MSELVEDEFSRPSPDMHPIPLPGETIFSYGVQLRLTLLLGNDTGSSSTMSPSTSLSDTSYTTAPVDILSSTPPTNGPTISSSPGGRAHIIPSRRTEDCGTGVGQVQSPQPVLYTPTHNNASSIFTSSEDNSEEGTQDQDGLDWEGYDSPPPLNERLAELRNERRYRLVLSHEYHPSRKLPNNRH